MNLRGVIGINRADVTYEVFDDEVVLINFRSGSYFSVGASGRDVVQLLAARDRAVDDLLIAVSERYTGEADAIRSAIEPFLGDLEREGLITVHDDLDGGKSATTAFAEPPAENPVAQFPEAAAGRRPFEPPVLSAYDDMQALLLLDPIHEVDESGWPNVKPATPRPRE